MPIFRRVSCGQGKYTKLQERGGKAPCRLYCMKDRLSRGLSMDLPPREIESLNERLFPLCNSTPYGECWQDWEEDLPMTDEP
jgi:hypothetical protein